MYNWCGLAEEGEEEGGGGGECVERSPKQRERSSEGLFFHSFFLLEGRKEISVEHISLCLTRVLFLSELNVWARAATDQPLPAAAERFLLSNEWSCFLPCWNTTLLWEPRKLRAVLLITVLIPGRYCVWTGWSTGAGQRAWFPKRINTSLHSRCVHTVAPADCTETKCLIGVFSAAFVHYCGRQMVRSRMNLAAASQNRSKVTFNARVASVFCPPPSLHQGGCQSRRDVRADRVMICMTSHTKRVS